MQTVDTPKIYNALHLSQLDACHGMVDVDVLIREVEEHTAGSVEVVVGGQEIEGELLAVDVLNEILGIPAETADAVGEF